MDMLAKLTNTDPSLLAKYKILNEEFKSNTNQSPGRLHESICCHKSVDHIHSLGVRQSDGHKPLKRAATVSDVNVNSISSITMKNISGGGSQPMTIIVQREDGSIRRESDVQKDVLRIITFSTSSRSSVDGGSDVETNPSLEELRKRTSLEVSGEIKVEVSIEEDGDDDDGGGSGGDGGGGSEGDTHFTSLQEEEK